MPKNATAKRHIPPGQKRRMLIRIKKMITAIAKDLETLDHYPKAVSTALEPVSKIVRNMEIRVVLEEHRGKPK